MLHTICTKHGKQYAVEIGDSEGLYPLLRPSVHIGHYRAVEVHEMVTDRPDNGKRSLFGIGCNPSFGSHSYREMPEELALLCVRMILEDGVPPPSIQGHRLVFTRQGVKHLQTGEVDQNFAGETIDHVIVLLRQAIKEAQERPIGFHADRRAFLS